MESSFATLDFTFYFIFFADFILEVFTLKIFIKSFV